MENAKYLKVLRNEMIPALGCTEPIAIAYAAAKARATLGMFPERVELYCSGNIIKNVKGVTVPNTNGLKGMDVAATMGVVCGADDRGLEVLERATAADVEFAKTLLAGHFVQCKLQENAEGLYIRVLVYADNHSAEVTIIGQHTNITEIRKDGRVIYQTQETNLTKSEAEGDGLTVEGIIAFAESVDLTLVKSILDQQIELNTRISQEGLRGGYGAEIGRLLLKTEGETASVRAKAWAAAGSDARMGGCPMPVVINSGSGNQGITVSLPVLAFARELNASQETVYRALIISNLISIHIKKHIGSLSAFCGAVSAACGAGAAITYMSGGSREQISMTIINTLANTSGIICDGAKASCAAKIASAVEASILAHNMSMQGVRFQPGEGIIQEDVERTIQSVGYVGRVGMKETDTDILHVMLGER